MRYILGCLILVLISCSPYRKGSFSYTEGGATQHLPLEIPKGYYKVETSTDAEGNQEQVYLYRGGGAFYVVRRVSDKTYMPINHFRNIPRDHPDGGLIFKGQDPNDLFWREIQMPKFVFGYVNIAPDRAVLFDHATNFASLRVKE